MCAMAIDLFSLVFVLCCLAKLSGVPVVSLVSLLVLLCVDSSLQTGIICLPHFQFEFLEKGSIYKIFCGSWNAFSADKEDCLL